MPVTNVNLSVFAPTAGAINASQLFWPSTTTCPSATDPIIKAIPSTPRNRSMSRTSISNKRTLTLKRHLEGTF